VIEQVADVEAAEGARELGAKVELGPLPVETFERRDERRRNDDRRSRIAVGIADEQSGAVFDRRWHEVEVEPETRKGF
jgi:hypothetical protein